MKEAVKAAVENMRRGKGKERDEEKGDNKGLETLAA